MVSHLILELLGGYTQSWEVQIVYDNAQTTKAGIEVLFISFENVFLRRMKNALSVLME